jgi:DNA-binding protein HU-beta
MNKAKLIDAIAKKALLTKVDARKFLEAFLEVTATSLIEGDKVTLIGFGTFYIAERKARIGRNPITGASLNVAAKKVVKFKPGAELSSNVK